LAVRRRRRRGRALQRLRRPEVGETDDDVPSRPSKSPAAFRTIGEVADDLQLPAHVLRFWESKFPQLKPLKRGGGRRYYRPEDVVLLRRIRQCLYQDGYTIRGAQKLMGVAIDDDAANAPSPPTLFPLEATARPAQPPNPARKPTRPRPMDPVFRAALDEIRRELIEVRALLDKLARARGP
jgi:DNA-binding transcriptional MerR regulator